jgi:hypothetical protein
MFRQYFASCFLFGVKPLTQAGILQVFSEGKVHLSIPLPFLRIRTRLAPSRQCLGKIANQLPPFSTRDLKWKEFLSLRELEFERCQDRAAYRARLSFAPWVGFGAHANR